MLRLKRGGGQSITIPIGNGEEIRFINLSPREIQIGVEAPPNVAIFRTELVAEIQREHDRLSDDGCPNEPPGA